MSRLRSGLPSADQPPGTVGPAASNPLQSKRCAIEFCCPPVPSIWCSPNSLTHQSLHRIAPKTATASDLADSRGPPLQPPIVLPSYERMMLRCETTYRRPFKSNKWTTPQTVAHAASIKSNITTPDLDLARRSRREGVTSIRAAGRSAVDFAPPTGLRYWPSPQSLRVCSLFV